MERALNGPATTISSQLRAAASCNQLPSGMGAGETDVHIAL